MARVCARVTVFVVRLSFIAQADRYALPTSRTHWIQVVQNAYRVIRLGVRKLTKLDLNHPLSAEEAGYSPYPLLDPVVGPPSEVREWNPERAEGAVSQHADR